MAAGWFSILNKVPWSEVIGNAPAVAQGAKKLWSTVSGKLADAPPAPEPAPAPEPEVAAAPAEVFATLGQVDHLRSKLEAGEAATAELQRQMRTSSELIDALAEQNTQLVARTELLRVRLVWLAGAAILIGLAAAAALWLAVTGAAR